MTLCTNLYTREVSKKKLDHFRKLCSVRRGFIGATILNFDITNDHVAYCIFFHCTRHYVLQYLIILHSILEHENSYIFEAMLIKIVI